MELPNEITHSPSLINTAAGFIIAVGLHLVMKIINMGITIFRNLREADGKKLEKLSESLEKNTRACHELSLLLKGLEQRMVDNDAEALKLEASHSRLVAVVRALAGDRWQELNQKTKDEIR